MNIALNKTFGINTFRHRLYYPTEVDYNLYPNLAMYTADDNVLTGVIPNSSNMIIEIDMQYQSLGNTFMGLDDNGWFFFSQLNGNFEFGLGSSRVETISADTDRHKFKIDAATGNCYIDDVIVANLPGEDVSGITHEFGLFNHWYTGPGYTPFNIEYIFRFRAWEGTTLIRDLVPVISGDTGYSETPAPSNCYWDLVSKTYYEGFIDTLSSFNA